MKKTLSLIVAVVLVLTMTAAMAEGTIALGITGPLTGPYAIYGIGATNGAEVAVAELNAAGGDITYEFMAEDDQGDPELAKNAYYGLLDKGVKVTLGSVTSGACCAVGDAANTDRVFVLTPSASNDLVPESGDQTFQICFTDSNQGVASAMWIAEHRPDAVVGVIYNNAQDYSTSIYASFMETVAELGVNVAAESTFSDDTAADFSVQVAAMKDAGVDLVFLPIYYTPAVSILTQAAAVEYAPEYFGVDGMDGVLGVEGLDINLVQGVMMLTAFDASSADPAVQSFVAAYGEMFEIGSMNQFSADAYDAVMVIATAIEAAGITPDESAEDMCEKLVAVMPTITYEGLTGTMTWSEDGTVTKTPIAVKIEGTEYVSAE